MTVKTFSEPSARNEIGHAQRYREDHAASASTYPAFQPTDVFPRQPTTQRSNAAQASAIRMRNNLSSLAVEGRSSALATIYEADR
ncbi:hypothetical protein [Bradyrhizobium yuanmingense]|uniref:hypothetical protein n=1 Tax=Bradyrhizobium yuanmingense TaxID=108015 RepID=UPI0023B9973D|nr:hypothetical protein [Bradyrhizobium yuanmingense]MDF0492929.1 hypothetical protein [Bradyrhizobium yuanmingense]